ncbi:MAG TPA: cbb3-type cytochrome c oxidase subunit I [Candidatus Binatia bacterium]|nr:cbb3-type cytochrome c oxidase subunit I [Candidatus Binatia bacterium]
MGRILFGNLTWAALPHEWFTVGGTFALTTVLAFIVIFLTRRKLWKKLWKGWLTTTDPKRIGIMYIVVAAAMFFRGIMDAAMIWIQQATSVGSSQGYLTAKHFQEIFTAHGDIMVFFVTMGLIVGLMNIVVPLQIGARDLASPFLNTLGFWLFVAGAILINMFFVFGGEFASAGWLSLPPLAENAFSPGTGVDYWLWSLQISGLGSLLGGINFLITILKMRAPGMTLWRMPMFTWTTLCSSALILASFPVLTMTTLLLWADRYFGMHFFTTDFGGNPMMYVNLIWMWGHPEVYILVLPSFGIFSEIVSTFARKRLYGYSSMVLAAMAITVLAGLVWLHHFFTMGAGADVNAVFGLSTMLIAIPSAVQILNWALTMWKGKIRFTSPMYYFLGFVALFALGGMAGLLLASPAADYQLHNTLFLVAHFHTMIVGVALFGIFAGMTYWFPKVTGFTLDEKWGKRAFWLWLAGFYVAFTPLYILGSMGAQRRLDHYAASTGYQPFYITASIGLGIMLLGAAAQIMQLAVSIRNKKKLADVSGDPWDGRTLEWSTPSPPPFYNFAIVPEVRDRDAFWEMKEHGRVKEPETYQDIHMPANTPLGIYIAGFSLLAGFALVWHITWMIVLGLAGAVVCVIVRSFDEHTEYVVPAKRVEELEKARIAAQAQARP